MSTKRNEPYEEYEEQKWLQSEMKALTFGESLKSHRLCEEWTQEETADKLGISKQQLNAYECGRKLPSPRKAYEIAQALGMFPEGVALIALNERLKKDKLPFCVKVAS